MKIIYIFPLTLALTACITTTSPNQIVDHNVMIPVPCKITAPDKPMMPLTETGDIKEDLFVKSKKALAEIEVRKGYESQLEAAIKSCQ